jgi:hypothetical protein
MRIAHHSHAAAQVWAGAHWHIPTIVLLREPEEAVRSLMMHHLQLFDAKMAFHEYLIFYNGILPLRESFILAKFETVTHDFGAIIDAVNTAFSTQFHPFQHTQENEVCVFKEINRLGRLRQTVDEKGAPYSLLRPKHERRERERQKKAIQQILENNLLRDDSLRMLKEESVELYRNLVTTADV